MPRSIADIPIVGGVDGGTEGFLKTKLDLLENGVYRLRGGISKRYGTKRIGLASSNAVYDTSPPNVPSSIVPFGNTSLWFGKGKLYTRSYQLSTSTNGTRVYADKYPEVSSVIESVYNSKSSLYDSDVAVVNGYEIHVFRETGSGLAGPIYFSAVDQTTGNLAIVYTQITASNRTNPRVFGIGNYVIFVFAYQSDIMATVYDTTTWTQTTAITTIINDASYNGSTNAVWFDVTVDGSYLYVLYHAKVATNRYTVKKFDTGLSAGASIQVTGTYSDVPKAVAIERSSSTLSYAFAYNTGSNTYIKYGVLPTSLLSETLAPTQIYTSATATDVADKLGIAFLTSSLITIIWQDEQLRLKGTCYTTAGSVVTAVRTYLTQGYILSKPFKKDSKIFVVASTRDGSSGSLMSIYLIDLCIGATPDPANLTARIVNLVVPRIVSLFSNYDRYTSLPKVVNTTGDVYLTSSSSIISASGSDVSGVSAIRFTFNEAVQSDTFGDITITSGGVPSVFDGAILGEANFCDVPELGTVTYSSGSGVLSAGTYQYKLVREYYGRNGTCIRSAPSAAKSTTVSANDRGVVTFSHLRLTNWQDTENGFTGNIVNVLYRTTANGQVFYRLTTFPASTTFQNLSYSTSTVSYTDDSTSDATLITYPVLYTTGVVNGKVSSSAILDNVCPPSCKYVVAHKQRFYVAGTPDDTIWYSKKAIQFEIPGFNELLTIAPFEGGRITGLASAWDTLFIFKSDGIWYVIGDGPDETGNNGSISEPRRISTNVGCIDARSIVVGPDGIFFQARTGLYMLTQKQETIYIGEPVSDLTQSSGATITSATLVRDQDQVRFTQSTGTVANDDVLVYDYRNNAWSVFKYRDTYQSAQRGAVAACLTNGKYTFVTPEAQEYEEDSSTFLDYGSYWVTMKVRTAWIKLAGSVQGFWRLARIGFLGEKKTSHGLSVTVDRDYSTSGADSFSIPSATIDTLTYDQIQVGPSVQRVESVRVTVQDSQTSGTVGTGQGFTLDGLTVEFVQKDQQRLTRTPSGQRS